MIEKLTRIAGIVFAVFWMLLIFLEYWQYHENTRQSISLFQFPELAFTFLFLGAALVVSYQRFREKKIFRRLSNGLGILLLTLLLLLININAFFHKNLGQFLSLEENLSFLSSILGVAIATYFIVLTAYGIGNLIATLFRLSLPQSIRHLTAIGIGIFTIVVFLFLFGALGILSGWVLWPLFGILIALSWRSVWTFLQLTLWKTIPATEKIGPIGISAFYLLVIFIGMNLAQVVRPFPIGFDAMTYYVNLSSLIGEYESLVPGYGAYNWSLFMSLGYLLFDSTAITLCLSFTGGILALFALFQLGRKWLNIDYSLIVVLLFYSLPMISWLSYRDMKVDMGLLFYALLILLLSIDWLAPAKTKKVAKSKKARKPSRQKNLPETAVFLSKAQEWIEKRQLAILQGSGRLIFIGTLIGFAVGIKFSALIILLSFIPVIAYVLGGRTAFAGSLCLILFLVLLARFDAQAALRPLHLWADQLQWLLGASALAVLLYLFLKRREVFLRVLKNTTICIVFFALTLSPWLVKNAIETKSVGITDITNGRNASPRPSIQDIQKAYEDARINQ